MSSIRVDSMTVPDEELKVLDDFMFSLGFSLMPGADNSSERSNMPWSSRWYRPKTVTYTDGTKGTLHQTIDVAQWLYDSVEKKK